MKLLIVGYDGAIAIENFYVQYMKSECNVSFFPAHTRFYEYYDKSIVNKILFRLGLSGIYKKINSQLREAIIENKPDVVWVFKGMEISPATLKWIKEKGIKLVSYNPDNPFIFTGRGSGNSNVTESIGLYDMHFTYNHEIRERLEQEYKAMVNDLPFGFDIKDTVFNEAQKETEINKLCFIGNPDEQRSSFINQLAEKGIPIDVYGSKWENFIKSNNVTIYPSVYRDDLWKKLRKYRVQLNIMRVHNEDSHNMRTFEIPAIGGIQLAPDTVEHRRFFNDGENIFLYKSVDDCAEKIKKLISLPAAEAEKIRANARKISIENKYSYQDRALYAAREIKKIL